LHEQLENLSGNTETRLGLRQANTNGSPRDTKWS